MITTKEDNYTKDYKERQTRWVVKLEDGTKVICDDGRPGTTESAWERLYHYCHENNTFIKEMFIQFRSHTKKLPPNKKGYFFSRMARGAFGNPKTRHFFIVGYRENGIVYLTKYAAPELIEEERFTRTIKECCDTYKYSLIDPEYETTPIGEETSG